MGPKKKNQDSLISTIAIIEPYKQHRQDMCIVVLDLSPGHARKIDFRSKETAHKKTKWKKDEKLSSLFSILYFSLIFKTHI